MTKMQELLLGIAEAQAQLDKLDFKTNKWIEGKLTQTEWDEVVATRDRLRAEINAKEIEISVLKAGGSY